MIFFSRDVAKMISNSLMLRVAGRGGGGGGGGLGEQPLNKMHLGVTK